LTSGPPLGAATTELIITDRNSGLAIYGFDPVAYFVDGVPKRGKGEFEHRYAGVVWQFRNPGNLAAFAADPDVYAPQFGGYDPIALGRGVPLAGNPRIWLIVGKRLYFFNTPENKAAFAADEARAAEAADQAWPAVQRTLSP
jgi:YHS domain-containing protein